MFLLTDQSIFFPNLDQLPITSNSHPLNLLKMAMKTYKRFPLLVSLFILLVSGVQAQSPANLSATIPYDEDAGTSGNQQSWADLTIIAQGFNNARRQEEAQLGLGNGAIADLVLPSQTVWDNMSIDEKFLFLINNERSSREGIDYGNGAVKGWTFIGVDAALDQVAQDYADFLLANNAIGGNANGTAESRIDDDPSIGGTGCTNILGTIPDCCHQHIPRVENRVYSTWNGITTDTIVATYYVPRMVYKMTYNGSSGSREFILLQDDDLTAHSFDPWGLIDDYGYPGEEGYLGIGIASGGPWQGSDHADILIIDLIDPVSQSEACNYQCTTCTPCTTTLNVTTSPIPDQIHQATVLVESSKTVDNSGLVWFISGDQIILHPNFSVQQGGSFIAEIGDCVWTGTP